MRTQTLLTFGLGCCWLLVTAGSIVADEPAAEAAAAEVAVPKDPQQFHLFLLVGQSNMAGRGKVADQDTQPHPQVLMFNKANQWVPAKDPLHFDKPGIAGVGLGKTFAIDYAADHPGVTVGLIPCAVGGSSITVWKPGGFHKQTKTHPWDDCQARTKLALPAGTLKGILWHQGESDSGTSSAPGYQEKLIDLVARFRADVGAPEVPFLVGQLGQFADRPWSDSKRMVDAAHRSLPENVPHTAFVPSDGLTPKSDNVHFDAASMREFGHRYYKAYLELQTR
ncbi:Carbohydrate acetyl esterase/feruloyl esterase precursor [Rosistilla carotiformis]|uniref:Carbohydrate acetyl esterase/feruloyl esterase n=1 Tax=Rosistilla carotiformis TaxID=2528017 RepID=A0A518JWF3_9BACT|nr:Carbohydrate acetyl esterase/feruloyl esterase precursor [Rosistilla carotiformis]